jgi:PAS domain S-box-containing protein
MNHRSEPRPGPEGLIGETEDFRNWFAQASTGLVLIDSRTRRHLFANQAFQELVGYSEAELRELAFEELCHPAERELELKRYRQLLSGEVASYESSRRYLRKDGGVVWVRFTGSTIRGAAGEPDLILAIVLDVSAAEAERNKQLQKEEQLELTLRASGAVNWSWNRGDEEIFEAGDGLRQLYGFSDDEPLTMKAWLERIHPDDRGRISKRLQDLLASVDREEWREEFRILHPESGTRWLWAMGKLFRDAAGKPDHMLGVNLEITERKQAELAREESARRLRVFVENAPVALAMFDADFRYLAVSRRWRADFVPGERSVVGKRQDELSYTCFTSNPDGWRKMMHRALAGEVVTFDGDGWTCQNGKSIWVRGELRPWQEQSGEVGGVVVFAEDFSELKELTDRLQENKVDLERQVSEQDRELFLLQRAISSLGEGVAIAGGSFEGSGPTFQFVNEALCRMTGYRQEELLGAPRSIFFGPQTDPATIEGMVGRLEQGLSCRAELVYYRKNGTTFLGEVFVTPLVEEAGGYAQFVAIVRDVTERKQAELALRDREDRLRAIFENAFNAIVTIDNYGVIVSANPATEKMFGYSPDELLGRNVAILSPLPQEQHDGFVKRYRETGDARLVGSSREVFGRRKDGTIFPIDISISANGRHGFTGIMRDISELRELQQHVLEAAADEQRRIGHELHDGTQQQLTGLGLYASTLEKVLAEAQTVAGEGGQVWQFKDEDWQRIRQIIGRLSWGLGEANRQVRALSHGIMPVQIDAEGLVSALAELVSKMSEETSVRCEFSCPTAVNIANNTVATHLYRIAQEAISNALKHGKATHLRVSLRAQPAGIEMEIRDNGVGMETRREVGSLARRGTQQFASQQLGGEQLGRPVPAGQSQAESVPQRRPRGMGMGLMKYRANLLGGHLEVVSSIGNGTILRCRIPGGAIE